MTLPKDWDLQKGDFLKPSEKLAALMKDERWRSHDSTVLAGLALEFYGVSGDGFLPQIVAVVERAEMLSRHQHLRQTGLKLQLDAALTALDEKLP